MLKDKSRNRMWLKVVFCTGCVGSFLATFSVFVLFANALIGTVMIVAFSWATYRLFFHFLRVFAEEEADKRWRFIQSARREAKMLEADVEVMDDIDVPNPHLDTCSCRVCR